MTMYGYARVSTRDQDLSLQEHELRSAGCAKIYPAERRLRQDLPREGERRQG